MNASVKAAIAFAVLVALWWAFFAVSLGGHVTSIVILASFSYVLAFCMALVVVSWALAKKAGSLWLSVPGVAFINQNGLPPRSWLGIAAAPGVIVLLVALAT